MITIRHAQIKEFRRSALRNFERRAVSHLEKYFPDQCEFLGDAEVLSGVRFGLGRASHYHLETERDLLRYLTLMFTFGKDYDLDPALPWAAAILTSTRTARTKTDKLQTKARNNRNRGHDYLTQPARRYEGAGS